jgi:uncharacterized repeat protein (TIGR03803 family)
MKLLNATAAAFIALFSLGVRASAQTETVLYTFSGGLDGATPYSTLTPDSAGNLYGTTFAGGTSGVGTVYELSPSSDGWKKILSSVSTEQMDTAPEAASSSTQKATFMARRSATARMGTVRLTN